MNRFGAAFPVPAGRDHGRGMAKRSKVHPNYKAHYRVTNWPTIKASWRGGAGLSGAVRVPLCCSRTETCRGLSHGSLIVRERNLVSGTLVR